MFPFFESYIYAARTPASPIINIRIAENPKNFFKNLCGRHILKLKIFNK